jgi:choline dehydrogenase-like flavoprotein
MGSDPRSSAVDGNCCVHGVSNLFIASTATFPTSSQANPTLTLIALSLRLAAHVRALLRTQTAVARPSEPQSLSGAPASVVADFPA